MLQQPLLSIIIPVYNREGYIRRCLESVIGQTMEELEILVIDDGSDDGTPQVIEEFHQKDPERVRCFRIEKSGPAKARNLGIREAKGQYITFVDSDDFVDPDGYEIVCRAALEQEADVVCAPAHRWQEGECQMVGVCPKEDPDQDAIIYYTTSNLWNKLFRRDFLQETGLELPNFRIGEDTAFVMSVMTWAKKLIYVDHGYYHYELAQDSLSLASAERPWIAENAREVKEWMLKSANPEHFEVIREVLQKQLLYLYQNNMKFQDRLWLYLKQEQEFYLNEGKQPLFSNPGSRLEALLLRTPRLIPQIVYINGFDPEFDVRKQGTELAHSLFWEDCQVIILNGESCDIHSCRFVQEALREKDYEAAGAYFAMERILDTGGFYAGNRIQPLDQWNGLSVNTAFFGYEIWEAVSRQVFGGIPGNPDMRQILARCQDCDYSPDVLQEILEEVLSGKAEGEGEKLESREAAKAAVYEPGVFVLPEYGVPPLAIYKDYNTDAASELRQYLLWRTRREWKEREARETELVQLRNKAYRDTLWQQKQRENLQEKLDRQRENLLEKLNKASHDLAWQQNQREHLQKKLEKASRDVTWQQGQRKALQEKLNKAGQDLAWLQNQREALQKKLTQAEETLDQTEKALLHEKEEKEQLQVQYETTAREKEKLQRSLSYRLGRAITWIPRQIGKMLSVETESL